MVAFAWSSFAIIALWDGGATGNFHYKKEGTTAVLQTCYNHQQMLVTIILLCTKATGILCQNN